MPAAFRHRAVAAWIGAWAILAAALAPGLSHLLRGSAAVEGWGEVCSAMGAHGARAEPSAPEPAGALHGLEHCPWCSVHAKAAGVPPPPYAHDRIETVDRASSPDLAEPPGRLSSAPPRARGPPASNDLA